MDTRNGKIPTRETRGRRYDLFCMKDITCSGESGYGLASHIEHRDKTASTNSVTFAAIDPKRADGKIFELTYEPFDADGNVVAKSEAEDVDWE